MITASFPAFWSRPAEVTQQAKPHKKYVAPLFIGDAVQPFGADTLLLEILRRGASENEDQP